MRILLVAHAFPPRATAGVEVYTLRLAQALVGLGHDARVFAAFHDLGAAPFAVNTRSHAGVPVVEINNVYHRGTLGATWDVPEIERAGAELFAGFSPQVVHFQHLLNLSSGLPAAARRAGARALLTLHDYWLSCPRDGLRMRADLGLCAVMDHATCAGCLRDSPYLVPAPQRAAASALRGAGLGGWLHHLHAAAPRASEAALRLLRRVAPPGDDLALAMDERRQGLRDAVAELDLILAPTEFARQRALEFGAPAERTIALGYGAVVPPLRPRAPGPRRRFGYVGTLAPHKGVHVLIAAFRRLERSDVALEVFGSPSVFPAYAAELRQATAGDTRIRFHGGFPEGGQAAAHTRIDALVAPSLWWENSPLSVLEALAAGLPVVASRTGGLPEIVPDRAGAFVPPGDVAALQAALEGLAAGRLLAEALPPLHLKTVEDGARELVELYGAGLTSP